MALHLFQPVSDEVSLTAIHSIDRSEMTRDTIYYATTLRKQHIFVTGDKDDTVFCIKALLNMQSYSNTSRVTGKRLAR